MRLLAESLKNFKGSVKTAYSYNVKRDGKGRAESINLSDDTANASSEPILKVKIPTNSIVVVILQCQ